MLPLSEKFFRRHNQVSARNLDTPLPELEQPQKGYLALCSRAQLALDCLGSGEAKNGKAAAQSKLRTSLAAARGSQRPRFLWPGLGRARSSYLALVALVPC